MSTNLQHEYAESKYGNITVGPEVLENDVHFWEYVETEATKKRDGIKRERDARLQVQDSRAKELQELAVKITHYERNGLSRKDEECSSLYERADMLGSCLKLTAIEDDLTNELIEVDKAITHAKEMIKRARFKQELAAEKAKTEAKSKVKAQ